MEEDQYVEMTEYTGIEGSASRTICAWVKTESGGTLISWGSGSKESMGFGQKCILKICDGSIEWDFGVTKASGSIQILDGQWHHVAAVLTEDANVTSEDVGIYVDGEPLIMTLYGPPFPINTQLSEPVRLGSYQSEGTLYLFYSGTMDDVRIYNIAISAEQIALLAAE